MRSKRLSILLWSSSLWMLSDGILGPTLVLFGQKVGGAPLSIGWGASLYYLVNGLVEVLIGKVCKGIIMMERIMLLGFVLNTIATFSFYFVDSILGFIMVQIAIGISRGMFGPPWDGLYQLANDTNENVAEAHGRSRGLGSLCMGVSVLICTYIVDSGNHYHFVFGIMGLIQTCATGYLWQIVRHRPKETHRA